MLKNICHLWQSVLVFHWFSTSHKECPHLLDSLIIQHPSVVADDLDLSSSRASVTTTTQQIYNLTYLNDSVMHEVFLLWELNPKTHCSQCGGCWWPVTKLAPGHLQLPWWCKWIGTKLTYRDVPAWWALWLPWWPPAGCNNALMYLLIVTMNFCYCFIVVFCWKQNFLLNNDHLRVEERIPQPTWVNSLAPGRFQFNCR